MAATYAIGSGRPLFTLPGGRFYNATKPLEGRILDMTTKHTVKQSAIISYLRRCTGPASPTEIGKACGKPYHAASAWASSGLKPLVAAGEVVRFAGGHYQLAALIPQP